MTGMAHLLAILRVIVLWDRRRVSTQSPLLTSDYGYPSKVTMLTVDHMNIAQIIVKVLLASFTVTMVTELSFVIATVVESKYLSSSYNCK